MCLVLGWVVGWYRDDFFGGWCICLRGGWGVNNVCCWLVTKMMFRWMMRLFGWVVDWWQESCLRRTWQELKRFMPRDLSTKKKQHGLFNPQLWECARWVAFQHRITPVDPGTWSCTESQQAKRLKDGLILRVVQPQPPWPFWTFLIDPRNNEKVINCPCWDAIWAVADRVSPPYWPLQEPRMLHCIGRTESVTFCKTTAQPGQVAFLRHHFEHFFRQFSPGDLETSSSSAEIVTHLDGTLLALRPPADPKRFEDAATRKRFQDFQEVKTTFVHRTAP